MSLNVSIFKSSYLAVVDAIFDSSGDSGKFSFNLFSKCLIKSLAVNTVPALPEIFIFLSSLLYGNPKVSQDSGLR